MFKMKKILLLLFSGWCFGISGYEIAYQIDNRKTPIDSKMDLIMSLTNKKGNIRSYSLRSITKDNTKKQIIWFLSPPDDKGVAFLKIEHDDRDDEMRIWLPAFKKVRRISAKTRSENFMGSDMSYEDMSTRKIENYSFNIIKSENYNGIKCYVLESIPKKHIRSEYSKHHTWIDASLLIPLKENSYDKNDIILKEKTFSYIEINSFQILKEIYVKNIQKNHSTKLIFEKIKLNTDIDDNIFHERHLKYLPKL